MEVKIHESYKNEFEKRMESFARKCKKFNLPFEYSLLREEFKLVYYKQRWDGSGWGTIILDANETEKIKEAEASGESLYPYKVYVYEVEDVTAKLDGNFDILAMVEYTDNGNIIHTLHDGAEVPKKYRTTECYCDYCKTNRWRKNLFIIQDKNNGDYKQVGSNCMKYYGWGISAEKIAKLVETLSEMLVYMDEAQEYGFSYSEFGGKRIYFDIREVLCYALGVTRKIGYYNSKADLPTKNIVKMLCDEESEQQRLDRLNRWLKADIFDGKFEDYFNFADSEIDAIINYYQAQEATTDFINNIQVMLRAGYVKENNIGFIACLPNCYFKAIDKKIEIEKQRAENLTFEHFGKVGDRATVDHIDDARIISSWESSYGYGQWVTVWRLVSGKYVFIWKTSTSYNNEDFENCKGMKFTVKEHGEFNGQKQTTITRAKLLT